jgi:sulfonate transport system substrate-binding protein
MKKKIILLVALSALLGLATVGCGKAEATNTDSTKKTEELKEINIGFPSSGSNWTGGALGLADVKGILDKYLKPLGYKANLQGFSGAAPAIHEALVAGDLEFAYYAGMAGILAKSNGIDTKLLAVQSYSPAWEVFASEKSGIKSIKELKGAKIAYIRGTAAHEYLIKVLKEAGLTEKDVELVNVTIPEGIAALVGGSVDAAVITIGQETDPKLSQAGKVIHNEKEAGKKDYYSPGIITGRTDFIENNKEVTVALLEALLEAKDLIVKDPDSYYKIYSENSGYSLDFVLSSIADKDIESTIPYNFDDTYIEKLKDIKKFLISNQFIKNDFEFSDWIDKSYLESAKKNYSSQK